MAGLAQQRPLWERIGREVPGVRLRMVCDTFPRFESLPVVERPLVRGDRGRRCCLQPTSGSAGCPTTSGAEGSAASRFSSTRRPGLPVVANPVGVHPEMIRSGVDGFLASTPDEWVEAIRRLATPIPTSGYRMGRAARTTLETNYSVRFVGTGVRRRNRGCQAAVQPGDAIEPHPRKPRGVATLEYPKKRRNHPPLSAISGLFLRRFGIETRRLRLNVGRTYPRPGDPARG